MCCNRRRSRRAAQVNSKSRRDDCRNTIDWTVMVRAPILTPDGGHRPQQSSQAPRRPAMADRHKVVVRFNQWYDPAMAERLRARARHRAADGRARRRPTERVWPDLGAGPCVPGLVGEGRAAAALVRDAENCSRAARTSCAFRRTAPATTPSTLPPAPGPASWSSTRPAATRSRSRSSDRPDARRDAPDQRERPPPAHASAASPAKTSWAAR